MSISNEDNFEQFSPSVATTSFDWGIYYFADTDISVVAKNSAGVATTLVLNDPTDGFSVQATNGDRRQGATITTTETYNSGDLITISRVVPLTQEYDLKAGAEINPTALNKALDRTVAQSQQLKSDGERHITHPSSDPATTTYDVPTSELRADKVLGYDSFGNITTITPTDIGSVAADNASGVEILNTSTEADDVTLEINGDGKYAIKALGVDTAQLAANAVETAKIADDNVTYAKIQDVSATAKLLGRVTAGAGVVEEVALIDDDTMGTATDTNVATSESIKAYVDAHGVVQYVYTQNGSATTGTTVIPDDDTIPQITEGDEYMTRAITPTNSSNLLKIEVVFMASHTSPTPTFTVALFQDTTADALAVAPVTWGDDANGMMTVNFTHTMVAGLDTATTFRVRAGSDDAGTTTFNGASGSRRYGGALASSITITELKV